MKWSGTTIRQRCLWTKMVTPFFERTIFNGMSFGLGPAGYDIRIKQDLIINPKQQVLASSIEHFNMPTDVMAEVKDKSTWIRRKITLGNTVIEPGWRGWLTLELFNAGDVPMLIDAGSPIAQIVFEPLDLPAELPYDGKYQDQKDGVQEAILEEEFMKRANRESDEFHGFFREPNKRTI